MNVVLAKIVAWLYLDAKEFTIMDMHYEMFLTIQLVRLTCRKDRVQLPTRKEGWDLFRRTSNDSSRFTPISIHEEEPKASQVKYTIAKKELQKNIKRMVDTPQRDENHLGNEK